MPDSKRVTLRDIARKLSISHVTVSLSLRNHPSISVDRRAQVKKCADEMGYRPDPLLSSLVAYRHAQKAPKIQSSIAWINHYEHPQDLRRYREFNEYWLGAFEAAERFGYRLDEVQWAADCTAKRLERILLTRNVRGVLIPPHPKPLDWGDFDWTKFSVIRFGMSVSSPDSHLVTADHLRGTTMAMQKIVSYGYERIGLVIPREFDRKLGGNYIGGYCAAQKLYRITPALPPLIIEEVVTKNEIGLGKVFKPWLERHKPDAILTTVPLVPKLLTGMGYRIPEDVAVAATTVHDIALDTGINQNSVAIGRTAVEMLVSLINVNERGEPPAPCRILVESSWQDGKSLPPKKKLKLT